MNCENHKYINPIDFNCVGNVAKHCDLTKLCIAIDEALNFDLIPLFCFELINDVLDNWDTEEYQSLIYGGGQNMGLKKVWVYYAYARYMLINQYNDSANGAVRKDNEWSVPVPLKEINDISNKYRDMGRYAFDTVMGHLCENKALYPLFDPCNCRLNCGCSGKCTCGKTKKITGFKFSTVKK